MPMYVIFITDIIPRYLIIVKVSADENPILLRFIKVTFQKKVIFNSHQDPI